MDDPKVRHYVEAHLQSAAQTFYVLRWRENLSLEEQVAIAFQLFQALHCARPIFLVTPEHSTVPPALAGLAVAVERYAPNHDDSESAAVARALRRGEALLERSR